MVRPCARRAGSYIPEIGIELASVFRIGTFVLNLVDNLERTIAQDAVVNPMYMDAHLLIRLHGDTVANGEPHLIAFCQDDSWPGNCRLLAVAGSNVVFINHMLNHAISKQAIFNLLCGHFNPMFSSNADAG